MNAQTLFLPRWIAVGAAALALVATASCTRRDTSWRTYREVQESAPEASMPAAQPMAPPAARSSSFAWTAPDGWTEEAGSGMRLASFTMGSGDATGLCTIVTLGGSAGGIEANVKRWMGQMEIAVPPEPELTAFIEKQTKFESEGGFSGTIVDFTALSAGAPSMLAADLAAGSSTMFIKLSGPADLLQAQKTAFLGLCKSVRTP